MKSLHRIVFTALMACACLGLTQFPATEAAAASPTHGGQVPKGKPFRYLHSRIDALQLQIDELIGRVNSLQAWLEEAQAALEILQQDTDANKSAIALLQSQMENVEGILATKQDIIEGSCPEGQYVYEITQSPAALVCRADIGASGLAVDTVMVTDNIPANSSAVLSAECLSGRVVMGGSYEATAGLEVTSSGIQGNAFEVDAANTSSDALALNVTATCIGIAQ